MRSRAIARLNSVAIGLAQDDEHAARRFGGVILSADEVHRQRRIFHADVVPTVTPQAFCSGRLSLMFNSRSCFGVT